MFQEITRIPTSENINEYSRLDAQRMTRDLRHQLAEIYGTMNIVTYYAQHDQMEPFLTLTSYVDTMNADESETSSVLSIHYRNNEGAVESIYRDTTYKDAIGIVIHKCSAPRYEEIVWSGQVELEGASEALKQTSKHFLKLFHRDDNPNLLFVWTNQDLTPETIYNVKSIQNRLNEMNLRNFNPVTKKIYEGFVIKNVKEINEAFKEFFESPVISERKYKEFAKTFTARIEQNKRNIQRKVKNNYESIQNYENTIARLATEINDLNMRLLALQNKEDTDKEIETLFKYLNKHPYITDFSVNPNEASILLHFKSPLIYFTDYAIEKIRKSYSSRRDKELLDIFIEKRFQLMTKCCIKFNTDDFSIYPITRSDTENIMGHPHIDQYGCLGNHREAIWESAEAQDYIGAIEQISQATLNINFYDACIVGYVMRYFNEEINRREKKTWLDTTTNELITLEEVIKRRNANEEAQDQSGRTE